MSTVGDSPRGRDCTPLGPDSLVAALRAALRSARTPGADAALQTMADKGLAHHHVRLVGTGLIARLPKHSQMGLGARDSLNYEAA